MKQELKEIVGYLPYGVKCYSVSDNEVFIDEIKTLNIVYNIIEVVEGVEFNVDDIVLILRPLSDLTKEITVNGETFVPIEEIKKISCSSLEVYKPISIDSKIEFNIYTGNYSVEIDLFEGCLIKDKLQEWHFDIHNLIEQNKAIDINTLEK